MNGKDAIYWRTRGDEFADQRDWKAASEAYVHALQLCPSDSGAWCNLGIAQHQLGRLSDAEAAFKQSLILSPQCVDALLNSARLLADLGRFAEAIDLLRRVLLVDPNDRDALQNAAVFAALQGSFSEAEAFARQLLTRWHEFAPGWRLLGDILRSSGSPSTAIEAYEQSLKIEQEPACHSKLLLCKQYVDGASPEALLEAHRQWDHFYTPRPSAPDAAKLRKLRNGKLRLGLVSSDFNQHPIAFLALPALEKLDRSRCEMIFYADQLKQDEITERFQATATEWHPIRGFTDSQVAAVIAANGIDVLVDLMGHAGRHLGVFSRRPASINVSWLGYVGTTGLSSIDYLLADRFHVYPGEEHHFVEKVLRMPCGYACYSPPPYIPPVAGLPALKAGHVTFGCFNNPAKISDHTLDLWSEILDQLPSSILLLKYTGLDQPSVRDRLYTRFKQRDIQPTRVIMDGHSPHRELLEAYNRIDIALDTLPYSGGLTTCEALFMGVPVITYPGRTFAGRHSVSHLSNAGFSQFVARDSAEYVAIAVRHANSLGELAILRSTMRLTLQDSALCSTKKFAADFIEVLETASKAQAE